MLAFCNLNASFQIFLFVLFSLFFVVLCLLSFIYLFGYLLQFCYVLRFVIRFYLLLCYFLHCCGLMFCRSHCLVFVFVCIFFLKLLPFVICVSLFVVSLLSLWFSFIKLHITFQVINVINFSFFMNLLSYHHCYVLFLFYHEAQVTLGNLCLGCFGSFIVVFLVQTVNYFYTP